MIVFEVVEKDIKTTKWTTTNIVAEDWLCYDWLIDITFTNRHIFELLKFFRSDVKKKRGGVVT